MEERNNLNKPPTIPTTMSNPNPEKLEITPADPIFADNHLSFRQLNLLSLLNKEWFEKVSVSMREVVVSNVWAIAPHRVICRFPNLRAIVLVNPIPKPQQNHPAPAPDSVHFWHTEALQNHKLLESLTLKRFSITDQDLKTISTDYPSLRALTLISCTGFSLKRIEALAANCRNLLHLIVWSSTVLDSDAKGITLHLESPVSLKISGTEGIEKSIGNPTTLCKIIKSAVKLEHLGVSVNTKGELEHLHIHQLCTMSSNDL